MSLSVAAVLLVMSLASSAHAERAIAVTIEDGVPFTSADLTAALRLRVPDHGSPVRVRVAAAIGGVRVETDGRAREVALADVTGATAARLVALAASDLLLRDLADPGTTVEPRPHTHVTIGALGTAAAWDGILGGALLDAAVARGPWLAAIEVGAGGLVASELGLTTGVARIGGGWRSGALELRAGAVAMPIVVEHGVGDRTILVGGTASIRVRLALTARWRMVVGAGADMFATRTRYELTGMPSLDTPWWAPWAALGIEVTR